MKDYKKYVKKELWKDFEKHCKINSLDFYSCGCILSAHLVMQNLSYPQKDDIVKHKKMSCKESWEAGIKEVGHSGMSAAATAIIIARYSPRGNEFKKWCEKNDIVMVNWKGSKKLKGGGK